MPKTEEESVKSIMRGCLVGALAAATFLLGTGATVANATTTGTAVDPAWAAAPSATVTSTSPVSVVNRRSGKCLEVSHGSLAQGTGVLQWPCHRGQHQLWRVNNMGNGYVQLQVEHSAQCLEVNKASLADGAGVLQWPCHGGTHQQWQQINLGGGFYQFKARHSGKCLEVDQTAGSGFADGAGVLQWPCHDGFQQQWSLR
jgi:hypothetical protein